MSALDVLFEDNHCLAVNKPAGLLSQGDRSGEPSLVDIAGGYLKTRYAKPGNVYVGLLHRLDRPASGVMLLAKTSKAAIRLSEQFRRGAISKLYWAIVTGFPPESAGTWIDSLAKDSRLNRARVAVEGDPGGKGSHVEYQVLNRWPRWSKIELRPRSGRSHQLRIQLASRGFPILGDLKYGATTRLKASDGHARIALHAREMTFSHPTRGEAVRIVAPVPDDWPESLPGWPERGMGSR